METKTYAPGDSYEDYEYYHWRAGLVRNIKPKITNLEYDLMADDQRESMLEYLRYVSRKIILPGDYEIEEEVPDDKPYVPFKFGDKKRRRVESDTD